MAVAPATLFSYARGTGAVDPELDSVENHAVLGWRRIPARETRRRVASALVMGEDEPARADFCARPAFPLLRIQQSLPGQPGPPAAECARSGTGNEPIAAAAARKCRR